MLFGAKSAELTCRFRRRSVTQNSIAAQYASSRVPKRSCGRVAEGDGLLNRCRTLKSYRGFESLRLRFSPNLHSLLEGSELLRDLHCLITAYHDRHA